MDMETGHGHIYILPEGCVSHVISLTSPLDACRSLAVSTTFRSAASSDTVWESFLPSDYGTILSRAVHPVEYSSKRELFLRLCEPILIDDGKMSFSLEKWSGAKCYMLSARQLFIGWGVLPEHLWWCNRWGDSPQHWRWSSQPGSRFAEVPELFNVCWLKIQGNIASRVLTPKTAYAVYLIFKFKDDVLSSSPYFGYIIHQTTVKLGAQVFEHTADLEPDDDDAETRMFGRLPNWRRADGWMEIEMGRFYNDDGEDGEVEMCFMKSGGTPWKSEHIIEGIEIRPKK